MITPTITVENTLSPALIEAFAASRTNPDIARAVNFAMRQWVSFAIAKIPKADREKIKSRLMARAARAKFQHGRQVVTKSGRQSTSKRYQELKDTLAAYIVWATNYQNVRAGTGGSMHAGGARFYGTVGKYVARRQFSSGYLKSGLYPALNRFKVRLGEEQRGARYRRLPGEAKEASGSEPIPEAEVSDWASGILEVAPNAFSDSLPEIVEALEQYTHDNLMKRAEAAGFRVRR